MIDLCSTEALFGPELSKQDQCMLAREHCEASGIMFNYYELYFCTIQSSNAVFFPIGVSPKKSANKMCSIGDDATNRFLPAELHGRRVLEPVAAADQ